MKRIKPSTLAWPGDWSIDTVGISQSLWDDWMTCRRLFLFKINGYAQPLKEEKVHFGNIVHYVCDKAYSSGTCPTSRRVGKLVDEYTESRLKAGTMLTQQTLEMEAAKAHATMTVYFEHYARDFETKRFTGVERLFEVRYNGCVNRGKIDATYRAKNGKKWLMEHKSKGRINEDTMLLRLPLDFQNQFYILNDEVDTGERAVGVLYDVVRNSGIKLGKNESVRGYHKRILESCRADKDHSFKRWETTYSEADQKNFESDLDLMIGEMRAKTNMPVHCNRFACERGWACEFLRACSEDSMETLTKSIEQQMDYIFPELKEVRDAGKTDREVGRKVASRKTARRKTAKRK